MKIIDLYLRILKKQIWIYALYYFGFCSLIVAAGKFNGGKWMGGIEAFYQYGIVLVFILILMSVSAVTAVTSDTRLQLRHQAAPVKMKYLKLQYFGANGLVILFIWMLFIWSGMILYGEAAYSMKGLLLAGNLFSACLLALALGSFIGTLIKTLQGRWLAANVLSFVLPLLGGGLTRPENSEPYVLSSFTPVFWYQKGIEEVEKAAFDIRNYLVFNGIQIIFAAAVLIFGMMLIKQKKAEEFI